MRNFDEFPARTSHPHAWLWEPLESDASFVLRPMFGSKAVYLDGRAQLVFFAKQEPWRGVLICTAREHHGSLMKDFSSLEPHPVLAKWLYLPEAAEDFETAAQRLVTLVRRRDPRIGVESSPKKKPGKAAGKRPR